MTQALLHIKYASIFKTLATVLVMLPLLLIPALLVFVIGFGLCMLILPMLYATGLVPSIPDRYVLWALFAIALAIPGVIWVGYIVLVVREQGRPMHHRKRRPIKQTARRPNKHTPHNT
jgi:hypothetical protein